MDRGHEILILLEQKLGEWVSGQELSELLQVSRTSVWKHIKKIQSLGYEIESSTKKGYRLLATPDQLFPDEVQRGLEGSIFGFDHYYYFDQVDSTNDYAKKLASQGYPEGCVVTAETQNSGRGRRGRSWFSPPGKGLYFSVILRPNLPIKEIPRIPLVAAAAVANTIASEYNLHPFIKWPNDIWIENRKIAGILTEAVSDMDGVEFVVVGIGLNVNHKIDDFPSDLRTPPTSLQVEIGVPISRVQLFQKLLLNLTCYYSELRAGNFAAILENVRGISLMIGQNVRLETVNGLMTGKALAIDDDGFLVVEDSGGKIHTIMSGEIMIVPPQDKDA